MVSKENYNQQKKKRGQKEKALKEKRYKEALSRINLSTSEEIKKVIDIMEDQGYLEEEKYWSIPYSKFEKADISSQEARNIFRFLISLGILPQNEPITQPEGYIAIEPPVWEELYITNYDIFQKVLRNAIETKSQKEKIPILYLGAVGDLYREPKEKHCYQMGEKSDRHKIIRFLATNAGYQETKLIAFELGNKGEQTIRTEIGKIRDNIKEYLSIKGKDFLQGRKGSGYRINPKYKIVLKNE